MASIQTNPTLCRACSSSRIRVAAAAVSSTAAFFAAGLLIALAAAAANTARLLCTMRMQPTTAQSQLATLQALVEGCEGELLLLSGIYGQMG